MVEPERVSYKEVVEDLRRRVGTAIPALWKICDSIVITGTLCGEVPCKDCPASGTCYEHLDKAIKHIRDAIIELGSLKRVLGFIIIELTGAELITEQEVRC